RRRSRTPPHHRQGRRRDDPQARVVCARAAGRRAPGARPRRPDPARAAARVLHPGGHRNDGAAMSEFDDIEDLAPEHGITTYGRLPVAFVGGEGVTLWDSEGKTYLDFLGGLAVTALGHSHPAVADALADQARTLLHVSNLYFNEWQPQLAERIDVLHGGRGKV